MLIKLWEFNEKHIKFIEKWEESGEIYNYLSHSRPRSMREGAAELWQTTRLYVIALDNRIVGCVWLDDLVSRHSL